MRLLILHYKTLHMSKKHLDTVKVLNVPVTVKEKITRIANNEGHTASGWLRTVIKQAVENYPKPLPPQGLD